MVTATTVRVGPVMLILAARALSACGTTDSASRTSTTTTTETTESRTLSRYPDVNKGFVSPRTGRLLLPFATGDDLARGTRM
jgi:hypothetical protein